MRRAFANKEESLIEQTFINAIDILHPLYSKTIKRNRMNVSQIWSKFNQNNKMGLEEFKAMIAFYLGLELTLDEANVLLNYIRDKV